ARAVGEALVANEPDDTAALGILVRIWTQIGLVRQAERSFALAREAFEKGLHVAERDAAAASSSSLLRDVAILWSYIGDAARAEGDIAAAMKAYDESLGRFRHFAENDPDSAVAKRDVVRSLIRIGDTEIDAREFMTARQTYQDALSLVE